MTETRSKPPYARSERGDHDEVEVSPLELFFDLVFVFALTQVTAFMADDARQSRAPSAASDRGAAVVGWIGYAWLANVASADEAALQAGDPRRDVGDVRDRAVHPRGVRRRWRAASTGRWCSRCYLAVRVVHFVLFWLRRPRGRRPARAARPVRPDRGRQRHRAARRVAVRRPDIQTALWALRAGRRLRRTCARRRVRAGGCPSPGHFSERHGLIVIIALGESIVAIGVGVAELPVTGRSSPPACSGWCSPRPVVGLLRRQRPRRRARAGQRAGGDPAARWRRDAYAYGTCR